jgi:hypothetical protein
LAAVRQGQSAKVIEALKQFCAALAAPDGFWLYSQVFRCLFVVVNVLLIFVCDCFLFCFVQVDAMVEGLAALLPTARAELARDAAGDEPGADGYS